MSKGNDTHWQRSNASLHEGHNPLDPRVLMVEDMAADQCPLCSDGVHRWRDPASLQFAHTCSTFHEADECEAHNMLRIAVAHGVPIYTGAELEFPKDDEAITKGPLWKTIRASKSFNTKR